MSGSVGPGCDRPGCAGTIEETGFCDTCWRRPLLSTVEAPALPYRRTFRRARTAAGSRPGLPIIEAPDPADRVLDEQEVPEHSRHCGKRGCGAQVGRGHVGQPSLVDGYCPRCGTPFSFSRKLRPGDLVADRYEVVGCVAHGGLGFVYLARDLRLEGMYVALKGLINTSDEEAIELAIAERRYLTELDHPNIVRIFDFVLHADSVSGTPTGYIVMEYVNGLSLREIAVRARTSDSPIGGPLLVDHLLAYGREILAALGYLHSRGLLYCDLKPDNVLHAGERVKVIDLGALRGIEDHVSPVVITPYYAVPMTEIVERGLTVDADLHTVGKTLEELLRATPDWPAGLSGPAGRSPIAAGVESSRRLHDSAAARDWRDRYASAAEMAEQLERILLEVTSLWEGKPHPPAPSQYFVESAALLDSGLGAAPALAHWTTSVARSDDWPVPLDSGCPCGPLAAAALPATRLDQDDSAADFLAAVSASDPRRLLEKLDKYGQRHASSSDAASTDPPPPGPASLEIHWHNCRAHTYLGMLKEARRDLEAAEAALGTAASHDWRLSWHCGLVALADGAIDSAEAAFDRVCRKLPGDDAPKLALGLCAELSGRPGRAARCYEAVWLRDRMQVSAAFGLARQLLTWGDRAGAVLVLDEAPAGSRHFDNARVGAVRVLCCRLERGLPTVTELDDADRRLPELYFDGGDEDGDARARLTAEVREAAFEVLLAAEAAVLREGSAPFGGATTEHSVRVLLEQSFRALARQARAAADHAVLVDLANAARPRTRW